MFRCRPTAAVLEFLKSTTLPANLLCRRHPFSDGAWQHHRPGGGYSNGRCEQWQPWTQSNSSFRRCTGSRQSELARYDEVGGHVATPSETAPGLDNARLPVSWRLFECLRALGNQGRPAPREETDTAGIGQPRTMRAKLLRKNKDRQDADPERVH